jgi:putative transposase
MSDILPLLLSLDPILNKTTARQLARIILAMMVMPSRITQRGIARWADKGASYRTVHRFFHSDIDWLQVKWLFFLLFVYVASDTYLLVADETVIEKAGKLTFGLDRFFSSLADKPIPGLAFFCFALVNVQKRLAYTVCAEQVVRTEEEKQQAKQNKQQRKAKSKSNAAEIPALRSPSKPRGRPKGSKNKNKAQITLSPELQRILEWTQKVLLLINVKLPVRYFVLDGHFGNHPAYQMVRQLKLHLISKMRHNAALFFLPTAQQKQDHPRLKYGAKLNYNALPGEYLVSSMEEKGYRTQIYQMPCRHKDFADVLNIVILVKTNLENNKRGHVVLFSSDLELSALTLIDYYGLRFQIEFEFRDAKQHFGLGDFMCVKQRSVVNAVGLSFFVGNLSSHLLVGLRKRFPGAGIADLKSYYRGRRYVLETLKCLPDFADEIVCARVMEQVCGLGFIHPEADVGKNGSLAGESGLSGSKIGVLAGNSARAVAA